MICFILKTGWNGILKKRTRIKIFRNWKKYFVTEFYYLDCLHYFPPITIMRFICEVNSYKYKRLALVREQA